MRQKQSGRLSSSEQIIRDIKRKTRKQYSADTTIYRPTPARPATSVRAGTAVLQGRLIAGIRKMDVYGAC